MAFSSSSVFNSLFADSSLFSSSSRDSLEKIVDGVPTGLVRRLDPPDLGDVEGLKLNGGFTISSLGLMYCLLSWSLEVGLFEPGPFIPPPPCAASLSDGPVNRCTTSRKVFESVCTKVVKGLQLVEALLAGFSIGTFSLDKLLFPVFLAVTCNNFPLANWYPVTFIGYSIRN